jgi:hypothetical protein
MLRDQLESNTGSRRQYARIPVTEPRPDPVPYPLAAAASDEVRELAMRYGVVPVSEEHWALTRRQAELPCNRPGTDKTWVLDAQRAWRRNYDSVWGPE